MFVIPSEFESDAKKLSEYATEHAMAVVMANFGGPTGGLTSAGRSTIWSEKGERLAELGPTGSGVVVATNGAGAWRARTVAL